MIAIEMAYRPDERFQNDTLGEMRIINPIGVNQRCFQPLKAIFLGTGRVAMPVSLFKLD
jgi:hypothetical protein